MRIGHGYDVHRFIEDAPLIIGGVTIPHTHGLEAHSDGDVLIHAICDALLGAAGLWDIGHHFPDNDEAFKGIDSRILLRRVINDLSERGWCVGNVDATIIAQAPKMAPFIPQMRELLAADMEVEVTAINIKATTTEKLGFAGRKEGIATHAVALIRQAD
ncbi:2-C-methyl-D-erythritol 2,4-cyclodiphosphate synthase [Methylophaga thalassica]|uniref:2-C-methyl-D-erythritol 2,4-cyclodiphosphate synthase n=1 Tax=Methylophaga thalassica TaxID=40223 RepID=UPI002E7B1662|nr:2-C-methyl-D-erythritol 2,4-cyclodiphosphate synthase [Methylophaga thalassica]WVI86506.1 2-C-methyl-D-erythritol 2,4-cyclodiphosphate synthase [Methylophaga thalassica]